MYQRIERSNKRASRHSNVIELVKQQRLLMPRLGTRKLYYNLKDIFIDHQIKTGRDQLFDILRHSNMLIKPKRNYTKTTNSKHWLRKHPNLYITAKVNEPNQAYVSDITFIKTHERTHYLSLVTDAFSRKIVGHHLSDDMSAEEVVKALKRATKSNNLHKKIIHHSDRGLQYCSSVYQKELRKNGITPSMTDGYDCYQNALAERVNGILKNEFLIHKCNTGKELKKYISESIWVYNNLRPHLSLNMKTPNEIHKKSSKKLFSLL